MMELFTTIPIKEINPTKAKKENDQPVKYKARKEPVIAKGIAAKTIKGCKIERNCKTNTAKMAICAKIKITHLEI